MEGNQPLQRVTVQEFSAKYQSKIEVYRFLSSDCRCYLPPVHTVTTWHLRDLCSNQRRRIGCDQVQVIQVPYFDNLAIEDFIEYAEGHPNREAMRALPSERKEILKLPRAYIANVIRTIIGQDFEDWVRERVNARNRRVQDEREVSIMMDPEIERIFRASTSTSVSKGNSSSLMKAAANRRRSKQQIEEEKQREELQRQQTAERLARMEQMEQELQEARQRLQQAEPMAQVANSMYEAGFLRPNAEGSMELVEDQGERESLQAQRNEDRQQQEQRARADRRQAQIFQSAEGVQEADIDNQFLDANQ